MEQMKTKLEKHMLTQKEREERKLAQGGTGRAESELTNFTEIHKHHQYFLGNTAIDFEELAIDYTKTFGKLVFLGFSSYKQKYMDGQSEPTITHYRYQVIDEVTGVDFLVNVSTEDKTAIIQFEVGKEIELIEPKLDAFAIVDGRRVATGFSVNAKDIVLVNDTKSNGLTTDNHQSKETKNDGNKK